MGTAKHLPGETQVSVRDLRRNLPSYLRQARQGASFLVTSRGKVVARLSAPAPAVAEARPFGLLRGRIRMAPDFDDTPADLIDAMEGGTPAPARTR
jgi:antitoxin (DNA-binding transcriptional repressor) of toxin-antitoxin stability system